VVVRIYLYYNIEWYPYKILPMYLYIKGHFPRFFEHIIVDSSVNKFFKYMKLKDYPRWYLEVYPKLAKKLTAKYGDRVWVVIPDYPDDYRENRIEDNTEKTLENVVAFIEKCPDVNWLPVIQARFLDIMAFRRACKMYREVLGDYPRIAIGTLCTRAPEDYAKFCVMATRQFFPRSWIHVFGPNVRWLRFMKYYVNSIDTVAYYKPPWHLRGKGVTSMDEYAKEWLKLAKKYIGTYSSKIPSHSLIRSSLR